MHEEEKILSERIATNDSTWLLSIQVETQSYVLNILNITFRQVLDVAKGFCSDDTTDRTVPPLLLLLLSRTCLDLQTATIQNIMSSVDEQFFIDDTSGGLTTIARLGSSFKSMSQELLNHYAR